MRNIIAEGYDGGDSDEQERVGAEEVKAFATV